MMSNKQKFKIGDIFLVPLVNEKYGVGRVLKQDKATIFIELLRIKPVIMPNDSCNEFDFNKEEIALKTWCYDEGLRDGSWSIIGNSVMDEPIQMPNFWRKSVDGKYYIQPGSDTYRGIPEQRVEVTVEDIKGAFPYGIGDSIAVSRLYTKVLTDYGFL